MDGLGARGWPRSRPLVIVIIVCERWGLTWSRSITEDLMISLHFWSSVSWYFCWDSKSWVHSVWDWGNLWVRRGAPAAGVTLRRSFCAPRPLEDRDGHQSALSSALAPPDPQGPRLRGRGTRQGRPEVLLPQQHLVRRADGGAGPEAWVTFPAASAPARQ